MDAQEGRIIAQHVTSAETTPSLQTEIIAGLAVFFSMAYVAFANPILLSKAGMAPAPVFYATCLMASLASFVSAWYARAPAALAPGLALSATLGEFLNYPVTKSVGWEGALVVCFLAGLLLLAFSVTQYRQKIITDIPQSIKFAVIGGIGAVLADSAVKLMWSHSSQQSHNVRLFIAGLATIVLGYIVVRSLALRARASKHQRWLDTLGRASFFISVVLVAVLAHLTGPGVSASVDASGSWLWLTSSKPLDDAVRAAFSLPGMSLFIFIFYILITDIVGSPYHLMLDKYGWEGEKNFSKEDSEMIRKSFIVDSTSNLVAPLFGTSPIVFYAENFAGRVLGGRTSIVALVPAFGFFILFLVGLSLAHYGKGISFLIPGIAVAPILFFVGLLIIAKSLIGALSEESLVDPEEASGESGMIAELAQEFRALGRRLPAALAIVITPAAGFDIGVATGILTYVAFSLILPHGRKGDFQDLNGTIAFLALLAALSLIIKFNLAAG